jgi:hypothetical protein
MGRPKKDKGTYESIKCVQCGQETSSGYKASFTLYPIEVTPDFFIAYDPNIDEYDALFCSKKCILNYLMEELQDVPRDGREETNG